MSAPIKFPGENALIPAVIEKMANPPWESAAARILIVRLSPWKDVNISTPHLVLFDELRASITGSFLDFAFLPSKADRGSAIKAGIPWFSGRASGHPPADFDLVMISNATALEVVNVPAFLGNSGLPLSARAREKLDGIPLVILGGSNASASGALVDFEDDDPVKVANDALVDGIFFGEGEGSIGRLASLLAEGCDRENPKASASRMARLRKASHIHGFWPCLHSAGTKKVISPGAPHTLENPLILNGPESSTVRLAITAGCPGYCSFCLEGWDRRPYRETSLDNLLASARRLKANSGADHVELYSFNFNTHSHIFEILFELNRIFRKVSFMSQRLDLLADTPMLIEMERSAGKRSFTLGVEGISRRQRAFYRKGLTEKQLTQCLTGLLVPGVKELKLFFIISGTEDEDDVADFESLLAEIDDLKKKARTGVRVLVSAGYLARLPFTPLQYAPLSLDKSRLDGIARNIEASCSKYGAEFRLAADYHEYYVDQLLSLRAPGSHRWLLSLGDGSIIYDSKLPSLASKSLERAALENPLAYKNFLSEKPKTYRPPFSFIEPEEHHRSLYKNYRQAAAFEDKTLCLGASCSGCGACEDKDQIQIMIRHDNPRLPEGGFVAKTARLIAAKHDFGFLEMELTLPRSLARGSFTYRNAWVAQALYRSRPGIEKYVFWVEDAFFAEEGAWKNWFETSVPWSGKTRYRLFGPDPSTLRKLVAEAAGQKPWSGLFPRLVHEQSGMETSPLPQPELRLELLPQSDVAAKVRLVFESYARSQNLVHVTRAVESGYIFDIQSINRKILESAQVWGGNECVAPCLILKPQARFVSKLLWTECLEAGIVDPWGPGFTVV